MKISLTKRQREELEKLATGPLSTHNTRFDDTKKMRNCARVQNSLVELGFAYFCDEDGVLRPISLLLIVGSYGNPRPQCRITDKGREVLKRLQAATCTACKGTGFRCEQPCCAAHRCTSCSK